MTLAQVRVDLAAAATFAACTPHRESSIGRLCSRIHGNCRTQAYPELVTLRDFVSFLLRTPLLTHLRLALRSIQLQQFAERIRVGANPLLHISSHLKHFPQLPQTENAS